MRRISTSPPKATGIGQLSLVEHALCPLDPKLSLVKNLVFDCKYSYSDTSGERLSSNVSVFCPLGLSASDELYLWGMLALTLRQTDPLPEFYATPHWCLRQLQVIDHANKRGGRQYQQFADAMRRLSAITYISDAFYDPIRQEHRKVRFHFFSYSLPSDNDSGRAWHFMWDPLFFKMVLATAGQFRFDLAVYRELDAASRRLFLFASKVLSRRPEVRALPLEHVAHDLLGFSPSLANYDSKIKINKCIEKLVRLQVLSDGDVFRTGPGKFFVRLRRGAYFNVAPELRGSLAPCDSPLFEPLQAIGFDDVSANRLIRRYRSDLLSEWIDITQAAIERFGRSYFHKSPMAFLVDSVSKAA
ncbi:MAG: hypothetical protein KDA96_13950, partial [Planctomycetaceae bacterium]|nr:hypothetical protein [Planctomycetaceae bacterium]